MLFEHSQEMLTDVAAKFTHWFVGDIINGNTIFPTVRFGKIKYGVKLNV